MTTSAYRTCGECAHLREDSWCDVDNTKGLTPESMACNPQHFKPRASPAQGGREDAKNGHGDSTDNHVCGECKWWGGGVCRVPHTNAANISSGEVACVHFEARDAAPTPAKSCATCASAEANGGDCIGNKSGAGDGVACGAWEAREANSTPAKSLGRVCCEAWFADRLPTVAGRPYGEHSWERDVGDHANWERAAAAVASEANERAARSEGRVQALKESLDATRAALGAGDLEMAHEAAARVVRERDFARADCDDWREEYERVTRERGEQYEARKRAEAERDEARADRDAAQRQMEASGCEVCDIDELREEAERLRKELAAAECAIAKGKEAPEIARLTAERDEARAKIARMESDCKACNVRDRADAANRRAAEMEAMCDDLMAQNDELREQVSTLESRAHEVTMALAKNTAPTATFADFMREVEAEARDEGPSAVDALRRLRALWTKRAKAAKKASKR